MPAAKTFSTIVMFRFTRSTCASYDVKLVLVDILIDLVRDSPLVVVVGTIFEQTGVKLLHHTADFHFCVMTTDWFATEKTSIHIASCKEH